MIVIGNRYGSLMSKCIILRGIPGSGKSYLSEKYKEQGYTICSSDDFFMKNGQYVFNIKQLGIAHARCRDKFETAISSRKNVVVDNTNINLADISSYVKLINEIDPSYDVSIIEVEHNSLDEAIKHRTDNSYGKNIPEERMNEMHSKFLDKKYKEVLPERFPELKISFSSIG